MRDGLPRHVVHGRLHAEKFDGAINIPLVQASIIEMAKRLGGIPEFSKPKPNGEKSGRHWGRSSWIGNGGSPGTDGICDGYLRKPQPAGRDDGLDP